MPLATVTVRYRSFGDDAQYNNAIKQKQMQAVKKKYPYARNIKQRILTDGIPDVLSYGDLKKNNQVAVRTEFDVTEEQAAQMKQDLKIRNNKGQENATK